VVLGFQAIWKELTFGQSSRLPSGLHPDDKIRIKDACDNLRSIIDAIDPENPIDMPEPEVQPIIVGEPSRR
jgi:hypothetical protein